MAPLPPTARRPRILLVEDDDEQREAIARTLDAHGYDVVPAAGVFEALRLVQRDIPELVVADLMLPDGDGMAMTRALRAISSTVRVPVVAITASARSIDLIDAKSFGAECVLLKPLDEGELVAAVERCLQAGRPVGERMQGAISRTHGLSIIAPDGVRWSVHQVQGRGGDGEGDTLLFVSKGGYRRVSNFPSEWRSLPPAELWALGESEAGGAS